MRRTDPTIRDRAIEMYADGMGSKRIARELGVSKDSVLLWVRMAGGDIRPDGRLDTTLSERAVEMYVSGMASEAVGAELGISGTTVTKYARKAGVRIRDRSGRPRKHDELALVGGEWVRDGLVMRWEPFIAPSKRGMSDRERRHEWEDAMFDADQLRDLHARYAYGCREPRTVVGERVYQRHSKRARSAA